MKYLMSVVLIIVIAQFVGNSFANKIEVGTSTIVKELRRGN